MMLAGLLWLGQRPRLLQVIAVPIAMIGLGMIIGFDWMALASDYRTGVIVGTLAALFYAAYMLMMTCQECETRFSRYDADLSCTPDLTEPEEFQIRKVPPKFVGVGSRGRGGHEDRIGPQ